MVRGQNEDEAYHHGARRRSKRYRFSANVHIVSPVQAEGVTLNMSAGGVRIALPQALLPDQECLMEVWVTSNRCHLERARVVWTHEYVDGWVLGLEFLDEELSDSSEPREPEA